MVFLAVVHVRSACLLERAKSDADAFADFYEAYAERVLRFMVRRVLDAEVGMDLMSETFALALERRRQFRGRTAEEEQAWLFAIARNELSHYWRRGRVERDALARVGIEQRELTDRDLERLEERAGVQAIVVELRMALDGLPDVQRRAVERRVVEGHGYKEIATGEGVTQQVARARVSRGLRALASMLREQGVLAEDVL